MKFCLTQNIVTYFNKLPKLLTNLTKKMIYNAYNGKK